MEEKPVWSATPVFYLKEFTLLSQSAENEQSDAHGGNLAAKNINVRSGEGRSLPENDLCGKVERPSFFHVGDMRSAIFIAFADTRKQPYWQWRQTPYLWHEYNRKKGRSDIMLQIKRGDIYYANLTPVIGSEQGGIRPVVIIQNDAEIYIAPLSSPQLSPETLRKRSFLHMSGSTAPPVAYSKDLQSCWSSYGLCTKAACRNTSAISALIGCAR